MYSALKQIPIVGTVLKTIELLYGLLSELTETLGILKDAQKKVETDGSVWKSIFAAIAAICTAITAVTAAIGDPEPISKTALIVAAIASIGLAIIAIIDVIDTIEKSEEKNKLQEDITKLNQRKRNIEDLLDQLQNA